MALDHPPSPSAAQPPAIMQHAAQHAADTPTSATSSLSSKRQMPPPSPHFAHTHTTHAGQPSYFAQPTPTHPPGTPSSILLHKSKFDDATPVGAHSAATPTATAPSAGLGLVTHSQPAALQRVGSPDGSASEASATASDSWSSAAGSSSTAPSSAVGSPVSKPSTVRSPSPTSSLATLTLHGANAGDPPKEPVSTATARASRSPSPHCHFAPLPKVDQQERPATRRNSLPQGGFASQIKLTPNDLPVEPFALELGDRLQSSIDKGGAPRTPIRRLSGSTSGRSRSPSPSRRPGSAQSSSRSHSPPPPLYHAKDSSDALSLHYIQGSKPRAPSASRERSHEREALKEAERWREEHSGSSGRASPYDSSLAPTPSHTAAPAPADGATTIRRTLFAEPAVPDRGVSGRCKPHVRSRARIDGGVEEVVEIDPGLSEHDEELDEVEELEEENEDEDENGSDNADDDAEGSNDEDEEDNAERRRNEDDAEDEDEDEEEEESAQPSKTALGAGVEVVHWHKEIPEQPATEGGVAPSA